LEEGVKNGNFQKLMMEFFLEEICDFSHFHFSRSLVEGICGLKVVEEVG
jgi:hypothetical protein